jgi:KDO2-lipid IV(A) lauroyltransferase
LRQRSPFRNWAEYAILQLAVASLAWTPRWVAEAVGRFYSVLLDKAVPRLRRIAIRNLEMAFPEKSSPEREQIANGVFRSIGRILVAASRFPSIDSDNVHDWIRYDGFEHFEEAKRRGHGVLFATAHLGNWELSAFTHSLMAEPMHFVVRPLDNPLIDRFVERRRTMSGNHVIGRRDLVRGILRALHSNEAVGILIDQNTAADEGVFVDFFGVKACADVGLAKLAAHTGAAVIPGFALWSEQEQKYILRFLPIVEMTGDAEADTQHLHTQLEEVIREDPDQWLWIHRRWKTRPPGEAPLY